MRYEQFDGADHVGRIVEAISRRQLDVAHVKCFVPKQDCELIAENFTRSPARCPRGDDVPGFIVGATHYGKTPLEYFMACETQGTQVDAIFSGTAHPLRHLYESLERESGIAVRPSRFQGRHAVPARAVEWLPDPRSNGEFLLLPHEDRSQVDCEKNDGWEVRHTKTIIALNFYPSVQADEGRLRVYDYAPDAETTRRLGLEEDGYPYPMEVLANKSYVELAAEAGDLVVINGALIHAVTAAKRRRIVINSFLARAAGPMSDFVYWT